MPVPLVRVGGFSSELRIACKSQQEVVNTGSQCGCSPASPTVSFSVPHTRTSASVCRHVLASSILLVLSVLLLASCFMVLSVHSQPQRNRVEPFSSALGVGGRGGSSVRTVSVRLVVSALRRPLRRSSSRVGLMSRLEEYLDTPRGCVRIVVDVGVRDSSMPPYPVPFCALFSVFLLVPFCVPCNLF